MRFKPLVIGALCFLAFGVKADIYQIYGIKITIPDNYHQILNLSSDNLTFKNDRCTFHIKNINDFSHLNKIANDQNVKQIARFTRYLDHNKTTKNTISNVSDYDLNQIKIKTFNFQSDNIFIRSDVFKSKNKNMPLIITSQFIKADYYQCINDLHKIINNIKD